MSERDPTQNDPGNNRFSRGSRTASFWILLVLMSVVAVQIFRGQGEAAVEFGYSEFMEQLAEGNVHQVTVVEGRVVEGEFRSPIQREGQDVVQFTTTLPGEISESLVTLLDEQGVIIDAEVDRQGWGTILIGALPWLLFLVFWIWIFRTMQSGGNKAFQFGRSKAKLISPDKPLVNFADVAGADEAGRGAGI